MKRADAEMFETAPSFLMYVSELENGNKHSTTYCLRFPYPKENRKRKIEWDKFSRNRKEEAQNK